MPLQGFDLDYLRLHPDETPKIGQVKEKGFCRKKSAQRLDLNHRDQTVVLYDQFQAATFQTRYDFDASSLVCGLPSELS